MYPFMNAENIKFTRKYTVSKSSRLKLVVTFLWDITMYSFAEFFVIKTIPYKYLVLLVTEMFIV